MATYKIVQNYLSSNEYEYFHDYNSIDEAMQDIIKYEKDDAVRNELHSYIIVDDEYDDVLEKIEQETKNLAMATMIDIGLPVDEAENMINDIL